MIRFTLCLALLLLASIATASDPVLDALTRMAAERVAELGYATTTVPAAIATPQPRSKVETTAGEQSGPGQTPVDVGAHVSPLVMRPGFALKLATAEWCEHCPEAKANAERSGVPVEVLDVHEDSPELIELWRNTSYKFAPPAWILTRNGEAVARWSGSGSPESVREMASYVPRRDAAEAEGRASALPPSTFADPVAGQRLPPVGSAGAVSGAHNPTFAAPVVLQSRPIPPARRQWSYNGGGSLAQHLAQSHGINAAGMSHSDMVNAHSHAHEGTWGSVARGRSSSPVIVRRSFQPIRSVVGAVFGGCPGGMCPR